MSKGSSKQPKTPDASEVAAAQGAANVDTAVANAWLNSGNQVSPWGNVSTNQIGTQNVSGKDIPIFSQTMTLSPEQQKLYEQGVQADTALNQLGIDQLGRIKTAVQNPFQLSDFGAAPTVNDQTRTNAYNSILDRAAPQQQRDLGALEARLAAQGIGLGSEAYSNAMSDYGRSINDFRLGADQQAGNEMSRQYGLESGAYQQAIANALLERQQPLQELSQFMGTSNSFQSPGMVSNPASMIANTDVTSPVYAGYNAQMQGAANNQATNGSLWGSLAGLGGSALGGWASSGFAW